MHPVFPLGAALAPVQAYNLNQVLARTPGATPSGAALEQLGDALDQRVAKIAPQSKVGDLGLTQTVPTNLRNDLVNTTPYASNARGTDPTKPNSYQVNINPNADRSYLAHELGHIASDQTDVGRMVRSARSNPALARSLGAAALLGAGGSAALTEGDDDLATSIALAYAGKIPEIADEILATKNGLAIMDTAGMRASLGQRGRLAAGLTSYLAAPLLMGATANFVGNQFDEDLKSPGEIQPT